MDFRFGLLTLFASISTMNSLMILTYVPLYSEEIGIPVVLIGYLVFIYYATETLIRIPIGSLADFLGHDMVILLEAFALIGSSILYILSERFWILLILAQALFALGLAITWVVIPSYISQITTSKESLPKYTFSLGIGLLIGGPLGGFIRDTWGMSVLFRVFLIDTIIMLIIGFVFYLVSDQKFNQFSGNKINLSGIINGIKDSYSEPISLLSNKKIMVASIVSMIMFMTIGMSNSLLPIHFSNIGFTSFLIGIIQTSRVSSSTLARLSVKKIILKWRVSTILAFGMAITGLSIVLIAFVELTYLVIILSIIWGFGGGVYLPIVFTIIANSTNSKNRGAAMGIRGSLSTLGAAIGVLFFTQLANFTSIVFSLVIVGLVVFSFSFLLLTIWRKTIEI